MRNGSVDNENGNANGNANGNGNGQFPSRPGLTRECRADRRRHRRRVRIAVPAIVVTLTALPAALGIAGSAAPAAPGGCGTWMNTQQSAATRTRELLAAMSTAQKVQMVHQYIADGPYFGAAGYIPAIPSLCLPALTLNDAGSGLADEQTDVTAYPAGIAQAASWDPTIVRALGASLGSEAHAKGIDILLAPDVDIVRSPLSGRTSETMGEDPYLAGQLGASYVEGVQSQHVVASVKQYDANNQETDRATIDEVITPRVLAEIYQAPFATVVAQGHAGSVMCAYNQTNGAYDCQNPTSLRSDLLDRDGFTGFVVSDWGATHSTIGSVRAGLDMDMGVVDLPTGGSFSPGGSEVIDDFYSAPLTAAVTSGQVTMGELNDMVGRILRALFTIGVIDHPPAAEPVGYAADVNTTANQAVALRSAEEGTVLLKDANTVLPLTRRDKTIAVIGLGAGAAATTIDEAGGSVHVTQPIVNTPLSAITRRAKADGDTVTYNAGASPSNAAAAAKSASVAIVYAGYIETEGRDLANLNYDYGSCSLTCTAGIASNANAVIAAVAAANPHTIVVLNTGGPALMPWLDKVEGVVEAWYPGQEDGTAAAAILFGDVDPAGKLPITFPTALTQTPIQSTSQFPGVNGTAVYSEGLLVGYRWYEAKHLTPLFPFGYGLSYTQFAFSDFHLTPTKTGAQVSYTLTNIGARTGADVGQVYVSDPSSAGEPPQQLKSFDRVTLAPGQHATVSVTLGSSAFSYFDPTSNRWVVAPGCYTVHVGDSSAGTPLNAVLPRGVEHCEDTATSVVPAVATSTTTTDAASLPRGALAVTGLDPALPALGVICTGLAGAGLLVRRRLRGPTPTA